MKAYASFALETSSSYQSPTNTASVSRHGSSYQPTIITLVQLQANSAAVQRSAWYKHEELHKKIAMCEFE